MTDHPKPRVFSSFELRSFRGHDQSSIYLAIKGVVYDVSPSRHLYGPGGPYHVLAGRECARALALFSLSEKDCVGDLHRLDEGQLSTLEEWIQKFKLKYSIVGRVNDSLLQRMTSFMFQTG